MINERVSLKEKTAYGLGQFPISIVQLGLGMFLMPQVIAIGLDPLIIYDRVEYK